MASSRIPPQSSLALERHWLTVDQVWHRRELVRDKPLRRNAETEGRRHREHESVRNMGN